MKKATQTIRDPDKRLRSVSYFPQTATFLVTFLNGRAYQLPRTAFAADLEFDQTSPVAAVRVGEDLDYYFTIYFASGETFEVPWDRVLYECEPDYPYFKQNRKKQDTSALLFEARQIRHLRKQAGLTQADLAKRAGMARPNLTRLEAGRCRPALETLERIARALGQPVSQLVSSRATVPKERQKKTPQKRRVA